VPKAWFTRDEVSGFSNCCEVFAEHLGGYQLHRDTFSVGNVQLFDSCLLHIASELANLKIWGFSSPDFRPSVN